MTDDIMQCFWHCQPGLLLDLGGLLEGTRFEPPGPQHLLSDDWVETTAILSDRSLLTPSSLLPRKWICS
jgi:hypothetical protein